MNVKSFDQNHFPIVLLVACVSGVPFQLAPGVWVIPESTGGIGDTVSVVSTGAFQLPKLSTDVFTINSDLYWDVAAGKLTLTATGNYQIGTAIAAAANPSTTGWVLINTTSAVAAQAAVAKLKRGTLTILTGASAGTVAMGASTWNAKPVFIQYRSSAGDGKIAAAVPFVKAIIAADTLTVTLIDKDGVATVNAGTGTMIFYYFTDAN